MSTKLPVIGSSAATTAFCAAKLEGPGGHLWLDGNAKVTAANGSYADPKPNAFSLEAQAVHNREAQNNAHDLSMEHCPGSTSVCRASCYVHGLEKHARDTYDLYRHNSKTIREILAGPQAGYWALLMAEWIKTNAAGGFRWHVSGDVFAIEYAAFIARVVSLSVDVEHWIYVRSFDLIGPLLECENLSINLSCDRENYLEALEAYRYVGELKATAASETEYPVATVRLAYLTDDGNVPADLPPGSIIFPDYSFRARNGEEPVWFQSLPAHHKKMVCPVDLWGKSEVRRCGPCHKCIDTELAGAPDASV